MYICMYACLYLSHNSITLLDMSNKLLERPNHIYLQRKIIYVYYLKIKQVATFLIQISKIIKFIKI